MKRSHCHYEIASLRSQEDRLINRGFGGCGSLYQAALPFLPAWLEQGARESPDKAGIELNLWFDH